MRPEDLQRRTKRFALRIIKVFKNLPRNEEARTLGKQMLRSGTSVAANYRAVCRSRSKAEFIARLGIVVEEIDASESEILPASRMQNLLGEANELLATFVTSQLTAKGATRNSSVRKFGNP